MMIKKLLYKLEIVLFGGFYLVELEKAAPGIVHNDFHLIS